MNPLSIGPCVFTKYGREAGHAIEALGHVHGHLFDSGLPSLAPLNVPRELLDPDLASSYSHCAISVLYSCRTARRSTSFLPYRQSFHNPPRQDARAPVNPSVQTPMTRTQQPS